MNSWLVSIYEFLIFQLFYSSLRAITPFSTFGYVSRTSTNTANKELLTKYDEYGSLPQLKNTYKAMEKSSTFVVLRGENYTVITYTSPSDCDLKLPVGAHPISILDNSHLYICLTGSVGDCRLITKHSQYLVSNFTLSYDCAPSGLFIAHEIGRFMQSKTSHGGSRPLACHIFLVDSIQGKVYEIDAGGNLSEIIAGVAGCGMNLGIEKLEKDLSSLIYSSRLNELKNYSIQVLSHMVRSNYDGKVITQLIVHDRANTVQ